MTNLLSAGRELAAELRPAWGRLAPWSEAEIAAVASELPLPDHVREWYRTAGPHRFSIPWSVEKLDLWGPERVVPLQDGYRWFLGDRSRVIQGWNPDWLVIGTLRGDAIIASPGDTAISMALHGMGSWAPLKVASDIPTYLGILTRWLRLWKDFDGELVDDDCVLLPEVQRRLMYEVAGPLTSEERAGFFKFIG